MCGQPSLTQDALESIAAAVSPLDFGTLSRACAVSLAWRDAFAPVLAELPATLRGRIDELARRAPLPALEAARAERIRLVERLRHRDLHELACLARPPHGVALVVNSALLLAGADEGGWAREALAFEGAAALRDWAAAKRMGIARRDYLKEKLQALDARAVAAIDEERIAAVREAGEEEASFSVEGMAPRSRAASLLAGVCLAILDEREAIEAGGDEVARLLRELADLSALATNIESRRAHVAATPYVCTCGERFATARLRTAHRLVCAATAAGSTGTGRRVKATAVGTARVLG